MQTVNIKPVLLLLGSLLFLYVIVACQATTEPTEEYEEPAETPTIYFKIPPDVIVAEVEYFGGMTHTAVIPTKTLTSTPNPGCSASITSYLSKGQVARVAITDGYYVRIRENPGLSQDILDKVPEGTELTILDGPQCVDDIAWWLVRTKSGLVGWMAEYQDDIYLLEFYLVE